MSLESIVATEQDYVLFLLRLTLGVVMFPHGMGKLLGWFGGHGIKATQKTFAGLGIPKPVSLLVVLGESLGSIAIIIGFLGRISALAVFIIMLGAMIKNLPNGWFMNWYGKKEKEGIEYFILLLAIAAAIIFKGSGALSIDYFLSENSPESGNNPKNEISLNLKNTDMMLVSKKSETKDLIFISKPEERNVIDQGKFLIESTYPGSKLQNPYDRGLGPLGRFDHSTLKPGVFIGMHPHSNDEILSYIRKGNMIHEDSKQNRIELGGTRMMMMNTGSGLMHQESVANTDREAVEMLQIFIRPKAVDLKPIVQIYDFDKLNSENQWRLVGAPEAEKAPFAIRSQVWLYDVHLKDSFIETPNLKGLSGVLYVFNGEATITKDGEPVVLKKGASVVIKDERIKVSSQESADLVFFIVDEESTYTRSGAYSG